MESTQQADHSILFRVAGVNNYTLNLKLGARSRDPAKMTTLLFAFDFLKQRVGISKLANPECTIHFDDENLTTPEEILQTRMEEVLVKPKGSGEEFEAELADDDIVYLNDKE